jgi:hypothetical protein
MCKCLQKRGRTTYCEVKGKEDSLHTLNGLWCIYYLHIHVEQCGHTMTCLQKVQKCVRKSRKLWRIGREEHMGHTAKKNNQPHPAQVPKYDCIYDSQYHEYETFDMLTMAFNETCKRR